MKSSIKAMVTSAISTLTWPVHNLQAAFRAIFRFWSNFFLFRGTFFTPNNVFLFKSFSFDFVSQSFRLLEYKTTALVVLNTSGVESLKPD